MPIAMKDRIIRSPLLRTGAMLVVAELLGVHRQRLLERQGGRIIVVGYGRVDSPVLDVGPIAAAQQRDRLLVLRVRP